MVDAHWTDINVFCRDLPNTFINRLGHTDLQKDSQTRWDAFRRLQRIPSFNAYLHRGRIKASPCKVQDSWYFTRQILFDSIPVVNMLRITRKMSQMMEGNQIKRLTLMRLVQQYFVFYDFIIILGSFWVDPITLYSLRFCKMSRKFMLCGFLKLSTIMLGQFKSINFKLPPGPQPTAGHVPQIGP